MIQELVPSMQYIRQTHLIKVTVPIERGNFEIQGVCLQPHIQKAGYKAGRLCRL